MQQAHTNNDNVIVSFLHPLRCSTACCTRPRRSTLAARTRPPSKPQPGQPISNHHLIRKRPQVRHERLHRIALCRGDAVGDSHHSLSQPAHKPRPRVSSAINNRQTRRAVWNGIWRVHHSAHAVFDVLLPVICCCIHCSRHLNCSTSAPKSTKHYQHRDSAVSPPGIETSIRAAWPPWLAALP